MSFNLFDAHTVIGRHSKLLPDGLHTASQLLDEMDHYGIAEALVLDSLSREVHPADGNARILEVTGDEPRLHPAWALLPPGIDDEQAPTGELLATMREAKVGAVWLLTGQYRFNLHDWCVDELLGPLAEARVPLFVCPNDTGVNGGTPDQSELNELVQLCRRFPELPVIVSEYRIRRLQRQLYRAMATVENLHLELSGYWLHRGIEYLSERFGAERLIYGSNWPTFGPHMTLATLTCAEVSDDVKRAVGGGNLRRLLGWCELDHPRVEPTAPEDDFVAYGRSGVRPEGMRFADCHGHLGRFNHYHVPDGTLAKTASEMERLGVEVCCVFSFSGVVGDEQPGNDLVAAAQREYPDRFVGFTLVNPHRGELEMIRELERGAAMGLRGVKLIPHYQGYPPEGPNIDVACRWAHERGQLILNHHWGSAAQMERLVSTWPGACFLTGHTTAEYAAVMRNHANLFVCSCPLLTPRRCEEIVAAIGADRFLFGSDLLDLPIAWGLGPILFARISADEKRLILGGTLQGLMERYSRSA